MSRALRFSSRRSTWRNQLLRDADWAGMAHGVEIRLPLVDTTLLETLAPVIGQISPGAGKVALAAAPSSRGRRPASACQQAPGRKMHRGLAVYTVLENPKA
jgi:hypothetical protein